MSKINHKIALLVIFSLATFSCNVFKYNATPDKANTEFVDGSQNIPLASGLKKIEDDSLIFDSTGGNVISVSYTTKSHLPSIKSFYISTLPQMGWKIVKNNNLTSVDVINFERENEKLEIEFVDMKEGSYVKFFAELGV